MAYIKFIGHAAFELELSGKLIYIDPWIEGNPQAAISLSDIKHADYIFVTHDHGDHLGNAVEISKKTGASVVTLYEIALEVERKGGNSIGANIGGPIKLEGITAYFTPAFHTGRCAGVVIKGKEGTIYHAGDTGVFGDMALISELYKPDIALLPIGGHFTMGPSEAAKAVELLKPKVVIPMHYNTFPVIRADPHEFEKLVKERVPDVRVVILKPGEKYEF